MNLITVGTTNFPAPTTYRVTQSDLDSSASGRSETGVLTRSRVRAGIFKIEYAASGISTERLTAVLAALSPDSLTVNFYYGGSVSASMYHGDVSVTLRAIGSDGSVTWDISFNLIEF